MIEQDAPSSPGEFQAVEQFPAEPCLKCGSHLYYRIFDKLNLCTHCRAHKIALRLNFANIADDLAQEVVLKFHAGGGKKQTIEQAVIDAIREQFGRSSAVWHEQRSALEHAGQFEDWAGDDQDSAAEQISGCLDFESYLNMFGGLFRAILCLRYKWGLKEHEIGHCFGISESRVCQRLKEIQARISAALEKDQKRANARSTKAKEADAAVEYLRNPEKYGLDLGDERIQSGVQKALDGIKHCQIRGLPRKAQAVYQAALYKECHQGIQSRVLSEAEITRSEPFLEYVEAVEGEAPEQVQGVCDASFDPWLL